MGNCLTFSKKYNELHKQIDKPINPDINETNTTEKNINETKKNIPFKFIENYVGNEYSISKSIETSNRLDHLIEYLENNSNSHRIYGKCENDSEKSENNSYIDETITKSQSHTFIITRSDSEIDKIDRRYTF
jgi:hypothetical protein